MLVPSHDLSDEDVTALVHDMDTTGFGVVENYVSDAQLGQMRAFVDTAITKSGHEYVGFNGPKAVAGSTLDQLGASRSFKNIFRRVYERGLHREAPEVEFYQILRCLTGRSAAAHSLYYHYDSYVVTGLIPVEIPTVGQTGDLLMFPNTRKVRRLYLTNMLEKAVLDRWPVQKCLSVLVRQGVLSPVRIKLKPGNLYLFWGYRSIHTNEACDPTNVRATALFHYANPHTSSALKSGLAQFGHSVS